MRQIVIHSRDQCVPIKNIIPTRVLLGFLRVFLCSSTPGRRGQSGAFWLAIFVSASFPVGTDQVREGGEKRSYIGSVGLSRAFYSK